ncbi:hypothetical protein GIB67_028893 [Kingdonia uniflora]|uniref:Uncharacterized protein n=1 Tax=Kingdonia uniflora TaxID=39325 RepID=A0A7J7LTL8_9MAGN|nr:hypothetical protein GIB67_028893 [Kingdonia uniflora]
MVSSGVMKMVILTPCWKPSLVDGDRRSREESGRNDGLMWYKDSGHHVNGEFSMAEAYEEFKYVLLALIYGKDDETSPVANEILLERLGPALQLNTNAYIICKLAGYHIYDACTDVDPKNLEVLLALGVSHTNELEQAAALKYLYGWLQNHPKYDTIAPPEQSNSLYYDHVARLFNEAAQISPDDGDVHIILGVIYNLSRE